MNTALMELRKKDAISMSEDLDSIRDMENCDIPSQLEDIGYAELLKMITSLPTGYRTVFNMYVIEGYSHNEISEALGISPATSRSQLQRARVMLQEKINMKRHGR